MFSCVNCGAHVDELYRRYSPSVLKVVKCEKCGDLADKYIEYDPVIVFLDLVLLEKPAYRHLLYNSDFRAYWKLMTVLILGESFRVWSSYEKEPGSVSVRGDPSANRSDLLFELFDRSSGLVIFQGERNFYFLLGHTSLALAAFATAVLVITELRWLLRGRRPSRYKPANLIRALVIGGCAKLLGLLGIVWRHVASEPHHVLIYGYTVLCLLTAYSDNAANMLRMGKLVNIWHTTCNSHSSNLLCKSLIDNEFAAKTNSLIKDFKHPAMEARLLQRGGNRMKLIAQTRWSSHRDSFRRCLQNLEVMRQIVQEEEQNTLSDDTCNLLFSHDFEIKLQDSILLLDPVCELTNICQAADCSLATACELWLKLELPANNANIQKIIEDRKIKALNIYGFAANFLHNIYEGLRFQRDERIKEKVHQFFRENLNEEGLLELDKYTNKAEMFHNLFSKNYESPLIFWRAAQWFYPTLSNLAMKLLNLSASTAQLERLFSEWSHVHSFRRNRLKPERSAKLVALYYDLKLNDSNLIEVLNKENENNEL